MVLYWHQKKHEQQESGVMRHFAWPAMGRVVVLGLFLCCVITGIFYFIFFLFFPGSMKMKHDTNFCNLDPDLACIFALPFLSSEPGSPVSSCCQQPHDLQNRRTALHLFLERELLLVVPHGLHLCVSATSTVEIAPGHALPHAITPRTLAQRGQTFAARAAQLALPR